MAQQVRITRTLVQIRSLLGSASTLRQARRLNALPGSEIKQTPDALLLL